MTAKKPLYELKPGDHIWWEGDIVKVDEIEPDDGPEHFFCVWFDGNEGAECLTGDWAVPSDEEVATHYRVRAEHRRAWLEQRPATEAKCIAAARRVAIACGKDPQESERQMRAVLDGELAAFEERYGEDGDDG